MRIGVDALFHLHGGGLTHLRHLLRSWAQQGVDQRHDLLLFTRPENLVLLRDVLSDRVQVCPASIPTGRTPVKLLWEQALLPRWAARERVDVLFCPGNISPFWSPVPCVVVFQHAGPFCASGTWRALGTREWLALRTLGVLMRRSARTARRVIFVSRYFRDYFVQHHGFAPERGDVIYHGRDSGPARQTDSEAPPGSLGIRKPYVLLVSHLTRLRNIREAILGFDLARAAMTERGLRLVVVGAPLDKGYAAELRGLVVQRGLQDLVQFTGGVASEAIPSLLAQCELFLFPSTCENCPNTLIEALAAGVPIASSDASVMPEIAGEAAVYFSPFDIRSIAGALTTLASGPELCQRLRQRAVVEAGRFPTWDETAAATLQVLERVGSAGPL